MLFTLNSHIQPQYNMSNQSTWIHLQQVIKKIINEDTNKLSTFNLDGTMVFVTKAGSAVTPPGCKSKQENPSGFPFPQSSSHNAWDHNWALMLASVLPIVPWDLHIPPSSQHATLSFCFHCFTALFLLLVHNTFLSHTNQSPQPIKATSNSILWHLASQSFCGGTQRWQLYKREQAANISDLLQKFNRVHRH